MTKLGNVQEMAWSLLHECGSAGRERWSKQDFIDLKPKVGILAGQRLYREDRFEGPPGLSLQERVEWLACKIIFDQGLTTHHPTYLAWWQANAADGGVSSEELPMLDPVSA